MKLCGFAEKLKCIIYRINVYSDRPCGAVRKIGICRWKTGHRTTLSFRTSAHYFRGNLHRIPDNPIVIQALFCRLSEFIHEKLFFYPGDCHASLRTGSQWPEIRQIPIYRTGKRSSYSVGALIERPAGKGDLFVFLSAKRCHLTWIYAGIRFIFPGGQWPPLQDKPIPSGSGQKRL